MQAIKMKLIDQQALNVNEIFKQLDFMLPYRIRNIKDSQQKTLGLVVMYHEAGIKGIKWIHGHHTYFFEQLCYEMGRIYSTARNYCESGAEHDVSLMGSLLATMVLLEWKDICLDTDGVLKETKAFALIKTLTKPLTDDTALRAAVSAELRHLYRIYSRNDVFTCGQDRVVVKMVMKYNQPLFLIKA